MPSLREVGQHGGAFLGLCAVILLWGGVFYSLAVEREQAIQSATDNAANLARAFEEDLIRSIRGTDQTLLYVRAARARDPGGFRIYDWAHDTRFPVELALQVSVIDKTGRISGSSMFKDAFPVDVSDREYFKVHADTSADELYISKPLAGRGSKKPIINLSRRLAASDGSFDGVVAVSLDPAYLLDFYQSVDLGHKGVVTLAGTDGVVRARAPAATEAASQVQALRVLLINYATAPAGTYRNISQIDHVDRIYAYRSIRSYPLIITVGVAVDEVLANYLINRRSYLSVTAVLTVLLSLVTAGIVRHQAGLRRIQSRLGASEAAYAQKSELLEATLEHMGQGIMMIDADRRVQVCNRRAMTKLDLPAELMAARPLFDDVLRYSWDRGEYGRDGSALDPSLRALVDSGGIAEVDQTYERTRPNGRVLEVQSTPLRGGGIVRTFTDITQRKATEEVLRAARDEADRASRAKSEFLAMMSHEIRSPMSGMVGIIELLRDTGLEAEQAKMVELAHESALSLLRILNDVLDFSKIEADAIGLSIGPVAIRDLVRVLVDANAIIAERKGLHLRQSVADDVPEWIAADPVRLRQVLGNLIGNAIKFTADGSVELVVSPTILPSGEPALAFAVSDSGIGMAAEVVQRLFAPFMQEDASTAKNFGGTGLGLSISRRLARLMGGDIDVTSARGSGSVFTLILPLRVASAPDAADMTETAPADDAGLQGVRVLAAEDQSINRWLMARQFARLGLQFELVEDGHQALRAFAGGTFDLIVTDCHMPGMDGMDLTRRIRAIEATNGSARVPILGLTADITSQTRAGCLAAGMDDVVAKPINLRRLEQTLRQIFTSRVSQPADASAETETGADPLFDGSTYQELFYGAEEEGEAWLAAYTSAATRAIEAIHASAMTGDRDGVKAAAHQLAGSSLSAGATRLGLLARELEAAAATAPRLEQFEADIVLTRDATFDDIRRFIAGTRALTS